MICTYISKNFDYDLCELFAIHAMNVTVTRLYKLHETNYESYDVGTLNELATISKELETYTKMVCALINNEHAKRKYDKYF